MSYDIEYPAPGEHLTFKEIRMLVDSGGRHEHMKACPLCHLTFTKLGGNPSAPLHKFVIYDPRLIND